MEGGLPSLPRACKVTSPNPTDKPSAPQDPRPPNPIHIKNSESICQFRALKKSFAPNDQVRADCAPNSNPLRRPEHIN